MGLGQGSGVDIDLAAHALQQLYQLRVHLLEGGPVLGLGPTALHEVLVGVPGPRRAASGTVLPHCWALILCGTVAACPGGVGVGGLAWVCDLPEDDAKRVHVTLVQASSEQRQQRENVSIKRSAQDTDVKVETSNMSALAAPRPVFQHPHPPRAPAVCWG